MGQRPVLQCQCNTYPSNNSGNNMTHLPDQVQSHILFGDTHKRVFDNFLMQCKHYRGVSNSKIFLCCFGSIKTVFLIKLRTNCDSRDPCGFSKTNSGDSKNRVQLFAV